MRSHQFQKLPQSALSDGKSPLLPHRVTDSPSSLTPVPPILHEALPLLTAEAMTVQPQLRLGAVDDSYEREADQVSQAIVSQIHAPTHQPPHPAIAADSTKWLRLSPLPARTAGMTVPRAVAASIGQSLGQGQPLPKSIQAPIARSLGADLSQVRVHTDGRSQQLNQELGARAFTHRRDVFFGRGEYNPDSARGQTLLAHELVHVVQQSSSLAFAGAANGTIQRAKGGSIIPGSGLARDQVFGAEDDRRKMPNTLTANFLQEVEVKMVTVKSTDRNVLEGWFYQSKTLPYNNTTVLILSGSGGSSETYTQPMAEKYTRMGARVVAVNYRGYGGSHKEGKAKGGTPTEAGLYEDAEAIYEHLTKGLGGLLPTPGNEILVHGYSLGGPVAATLVKRVLKAGKTVKGLVLDRPMTSTYEAARTGANPAMALGAKTAIGSFSTKDKLKKIQQLNPNLPIVITSAGSDENTVNDPNVEVNLNDATDTTPNSAMALANKASKAKDDLAQKDAELATWATNQSGLTNVSPVSVPTATHFSQGKVMDELIQELLKQNLTTDQGHGASQNPSNLARLTANDVIEFVKIINYLATLRDGFSGINVGLAQYYRPIKNEVVQRVNTYTTAITNKDSQAILTLLPTALTYKLDVQTRTFSMLTDLLTRLDQTFPDPNLRNAARLEVQTAIGLVY